MTTRPGTPRTRRGPRDTSAQHMRETRQHPECRECRNGDTGMREGLRDTAWARVGMHATWHDVAQPGENGRNLERPGATMCDLRELARPGTTLRGHMRPCVPIRNSARPCATRRDPAQAHATTRSGNNVQSKHLSLRTAKTGQPIQTEEDRQDISPDIISRSPSRL